jgi:penicillin-binding protein 1C
MVGSAGFDESDGQINIVTRRRHPGSALKPFVYALAIEAGESPASIAYDIHDVPSDYRVKTLTQKEHGPVRYRTALAGSYNLAAVHVLEKVGTARLMSVLRRAGVGALDGNTDTYGLRLALGSAKVRLVDLAAAYGFLVKEGHVSRPHPVLQIRAHDGRIERPARALQRRIFSPQTSWLVMDMLADPEARREVFGQELPLDLPFRVAAKTGTSRGFADTVAIAVTNEVTVAAWGGNFDGTPTHGLVAMQSAAPLVRAGLLLAANEQPLTLPEPPPGITTAYVCPLSGKLVGPDCPHRKLEYFAAGHAPTEHCTWHRHDGDRLVVDYPPDVEPWARRERERGGRHLAQSH